MMRVFQSVDTFWLHFIYCSQTFYAELYAVFRSRPVPSYQMPVQNFAWYPVEGLGLTDCASSVVLSKI